MKTVTMPKKVSMKKTGKAPNPRSFPVSMLVSMRTKFHNTNWRKESRQEAKRNLNREQ